MRLSQFVQQYLVVRSHQSEEYKKAVQRAVRRFIQVNGDLLVNQISSEHFGQFMASLHGSSYTLRGYMAMLKAMLHEAVEMGIINQLPRFPKIRLEKKAPDAWDVDDVSRLLAFVQTLPGTIGEIPANLWWSSLLLAAYYTGLRLSGLLNVRWWQVDLGNGYLRALTNKNKLEQVFAIPQDLVQILRQIKKPPRERVWEHPYAEKWPCKALRRIVDSAAIPAPKSLHGQLFQKMRRTCITWTAVSDLSLATRVAGHASPDTTIRHYVDPRMLGAIRPVVPKIHVSLG